MILILAIIGGLAWLAVAGWLYAQVAALPMWAFLPVGAAVLIGYCGATFILLVMVGHAMSGAQ